jgi:hypothetical protein
MKTTPVSICTWFVCGQMAPSASSSEGEAFCRYRVSGWIPLLLLLLSFWLWMWVSDVVVAVTYTPCEGPSSAGAHVANPTTPGCACQLIDDTLLRGKINNTSLEATTKLPLGTPLSNKTQNCSSNNSIGV